ncbi:MAG TPA: phenylalanine--tRNA ligase subunit alpha, partial [Anaerolineales bacterium]|nr:phenylalanine--tRNA ligase subunit alpha [Anaerolineales bacterium]
MSVLDRLVELEREGLRALDSAEDESALQAWKVAFLGRSAELSRILDELRDLPKEQRPAAGRRANQLKGALESAYRERLEGARSA